MTITDKKILFKFSIPEIIKVEGKEDETKNHDYVIVKQTSKITEEAQLFYAKTYSNLLEQGIMPAKLVEKRFVQDGGVLSKKELDLREELYNKLFDLTEKIKKIEENKGATEEQKKEKDSLDEDRKNLISEIASIERNNTGLFDNTAENLANQKTVLFYGLNLAYEKQNDKYVPFFGEGDFEKKKERMHAIEDDGSDFEIKVMAVFLGITSVYLNNKNITQEDINDIIANIK